MPSQDTSGVKEKIVTFIRMKGPCLPVHIAKEIGMNTLFTSAFLSELISEQRIKTSDMRIGSSKLHFVSGQESKLENFAQHLKSKEKDAFNLLKEKKFLKDPEVEPAIRVALRAIKDFAIPFRKENIIIWRYFTIPESEFITETKPELKKEIPKEEPVEKPKIEEKEDKKSEESKQIIEIFDKKSEEPVEKPKTKAKKTIKKKKSSSKKNEKFFNKIKEFLNERKIEILDIETFNKNDLTLKVKQNQEEQLLIAYNKKRITEADIIKAGNKATDYNLPYTILSLGEPLKKVINLIEAVKNLSGLEKVE